MGFRFFRRVKIAPGVSLNLSKSGPSFSFGPRGMKYTVGPRGTRKSFGIPGTGLSYTTTSGWGKKQSVALQTSTSSEPPSLDLGFFRNMFISSEERGLVAGMKLYLAGQTDAAYTTFRANGNLVDSVFMFGFVALGRDLFQEAESAFLKCRGSVGEVGKAIHKYIQGFRLSLQVTEYFDALIDVDERGLSLALIEAYQRQGRFVDAIREGQVLWNINPSDTVVCLSLCDLVVGNPAATRADLESLVQMTASVENDDPIHAGILYLRGAAMFRMHLEQAAIQQLSVVLRRKIDRPESLLQQTRYLRGRLYEQQGQNARARKDYELVYADDPGFKDIRMRLGKLP